MRKHLRFKNVTAAAAMAMLLAINGCGYSVTAEDTVVDKATSVLSSDHSAPITATATTTKLKVKTEDTEETWNATAATTITLEGTTATVNGSGATVKERVVTISQAGEYILSGQLTDGQIVVDAAKSDTVRLVLNGVDITNKTGAPLYGASCDKLIITLAEGTSNQLTDGGTAFTYEKEEDKEPNATLFSKDDLTINGNGALTVNAGFNNGITTKDDLIIVDGHITINAANHGIRGNDSITVLNGILTIQAGNDGLQTNNDSEADKSWILINGGSFNIVSAHDGLQADTAMSITEGIFNISAGGGVSKNLTITDGDTASDSAKGIKASGELNISGGTFTIDSYDDSLHGNTNVNISDGEFNLASGDDGIHADEELVITGGEINITQSYEGLEGNNVTISSGLINIKSKDDGINAAGGTDSSGFGGFFGGDKFGGGGNHAINMNGGDITISASGDGLDSNGSLTISDGKLTVIASGAGDNESLDADGAIRLDGGEIIFGGVSTGQPGTASAQSYVVYSEQVTAGSVIDVKQGEQTLITYTATENTRYLALSSPDIISGQNYDFYLDGTLATAVTAGVGATSMQMGGGRGDRMPGGGKGNWGEMDPSQGEPLRGENRNALSLEDRKAQLEQEVSEGRITAEQAEELLKQMEGGSMRHGNPPQEMVPQP